jgi:hypothetical protein
MNPASNLVVKIPLLLGGALFLRHIIQPPQHSVCQTEKELHAEDNQASYQGEYRPHEEKFPRILGRPSTLRW